MRIRIDLKIIIFLIIFYFTNQLEMYITIMFFCFLHELGHILTGIILKMSVTKIEITPFGLSSCFKANESNFNRKILEIKKIIVAVSGPIVSIILAIIFDQLDGLNITKITKQNLIYSNILIFIFNLIPIYPLDGGRIIKGITYILLGQEKSEEIGNKITYITLIILTIISSVAVYYLKNIAIFLVCIFLWILTLQEKNGKILDILR